MNIYEKSMSLRVSECGFNGLWRPGALLTEMQEAAGEHCTAMKCGRETLIGQGLVWVVARIGLQVIRYPSFGETLRIRTFHRPVRHRFFPRFFTVHDAQDRLICQASSLWLLMDLETRQSVNANRLPNTMPDNSGLPEPMPMPGAILQPDAPETVIPYQPVYTDLDVNGHVNNTKYIDWLCNALGPEIMAEHPPETLTIHYDSEIRPEQQIELRLQRDGLQYRMAGLHEGRTAFEIGGKLTEKLL